MGRIDGPAHGYEVLFSDVYGRIRSGEWGPHHRLPSERELCERYGVSRTMVRQALQKAEQHGLLVRAPGRGTFVAPPRVRQPLADMNSFRSTLSRHALRPLHRILAVRWESDGVLTVETLGLGDGRPMALYRSVLEAPLAMVVEAALERAGDATDRATYELAAEALGAGTLEAEQDFEATGIDAAAAALLQAPVGSPAFRVTTAFRTRDGRLVERRTAIYPGDRYTFQVHRNFDVTPP